MVEIPIVLFGAWMFLLASLIFCFFYSRGTAKNLKLAVESRDRTIAVLEHQLTYYKTHCGEPP